MHSWTLPIPILLWRLLGVNGNQNDLGELRSTEIRRGFQIGQSSNMVLCKFTYYQGSDKVHSIAGSATFDWFNSQLWTWLNFLNLLLLKASKRQRNFLWKSSDIVQVFGLYIEKVISKWVQEYLFYTNTMTNIGTITGTEFIFKCDEFFSYS